MKAADCYESFFERKLFPYEDIHQFISGIGSCYKIEVFEVDHFDKNTLYPPLLEQ